MTLNCENPTKVILKYTSIIPNKIQYSGMKYPSVRLSERPRVGYFYVGNVIYPNTENVDNFKIQPSDPNVEITWDFTTNSEITWYRYPLKVVYAGTKNNPKTHEFDVFFPGFIQTIGFWFDDEGTVYWQIEELDMPKTPTVVRPGFYKVDSPITGTTSNQILDISIGSGAIHDELGYAWNMDIYFDGQYQLRKLVRSNTGNPPSDGVSVIEGKPGEPKEETFKFNEFSEFGDKPKFIKLKKKEETEYTWELITNNSVENSEESDVIFKQFYGIAPELLCFGEENQCPENTCEVSCQGHFCCYNENGISVFSFVK